MAKNRTCICCGAVYSYCPNCSKIDAAKPSWQSTFCSADCMTLWTTATKYNMQMLSKQEAKAIISALALKPKENYTSCVQRDLDVILAEDDLTEEHPQQCHEASHEVVEKEK